MVYNTTTNNEGLGNDATGDQGDRADAWGVLVDVGAFGIQGDQLESTPISGVGDLLNTSFRSPRPTLGVSLVSQVQSPSSDTDVGAYFFDDGSPVSTRLPGTEGALREVSLPVDSVGLSQTPQGLSTLPPLDVADGFVTDFFVVISFVAGKGWFGGGGVVTVKKQLLRIFCPGLIRINSLIRPREAQFQKAVVFFCGII